MKGLGETQICVSTSIRCRYHLGVILAVIQHCMILIVASLVELYQKCGKQNKILLYLRKEIKHHHPTIYRLVVLSLTSVICKVMDKLVRKRIVEHKSNKYLISNKQFGFICRRSTRHRQTTTKTHHYAQSNAT